MIPRLINERDIETWIAQLEKTETQKGTLLHPTTIAHAFKLLHNMFNYGKLERILRENPCEFVHKKPTEKPSEREFFTIEEMDYIKELLATANIRLKTAIFLIIDTGCRREEIIGLKWEDIDFEKNKLTEIYKLDYRIKSICEGFGKYDVCFIFDDGVLHYGCNY